MITATALRKEFQVSRRPPGLRAALASLLHRRTETVVAVDEVSFSIAEGERVGFLGPNGAGKTTTLKMLAGLLHPTRGQAEVGGFVPHRRERGFLCAITLVMGQKQQLIWDLPPSETFAMNRAIFDVPVREYKDALDELVTLLSLAPVLDKPTRQLSLGERMRCELAAALIHRPKVLFLDEPTIGLDVEMQLAIREFIRSYNQRHRATVMLTSHYMDDVVALCPRVIVIDGGKLLHDGDLRTLIKAKDPDKRVSCLVPRAVAEPDVMPQVAARLAGLGEVTLEGARLRLRLPESRLAEVIGILLSELRVSDLSIEDPPLEDVMRAMFRKPAASQEPARDASAEARE
ncbi:MAG: ATP-binding cassette domain-containing protein [Myxococcales bacterium]|nr:ATP-binding cassette domain-containing protein [Myxococcales bacterium]